MSTFILNHDHPGREHVLANAQRFLAQLPTAKSWEITVKLFKRQRTSLQCNGLFGVAYPPLMEFVGLQGDEDKKQLHRQMCGDFFGWVEGLPMNLRKPVRTTTTDENGKRDVVPWDVFCDFYGFVQRRGAEFGVFIPDPDPLWRKTP